MEITKEIEIYNGHPLGKTVKGLNKCQQQKLYSFFRVIKIESINFISSESDIGHFHDKEM